MTRQTNFTHAIGLAGISALRKKYQAMLDLRSKREAWQQAGLLRVPDEALAARQKQSQDLAQEFPGVLRQVDALELGAIQERLDLLEGLVQEEAERPEDLPTWALVEWDYHKLQKEALSFKAWKRKFEVPEQKTVDYVTFFDWWENSSKRATPPGCMSEALFLEWCSPPSGRSSILIWRVLSEHYGVSEGALRQMLFAST